MSVNVRERSSSASNNGGLIQQQSKIYRPVKNASILSNGIINSAVIDAPVLENQEVAPVAKKLKAIKNASVAKVIAQKISNKDTGLHIKNFVWNIN